VSPPLGVSGGHIVASCNSSTSPSFCERARFSRRNVYPFSLSVAAHEALQLVGLLTGMERVGGTGAQQYHAYPGEMVVTWASCSDGCEFAALTASAPDLSGNLASNQQNDD
jgi:hypothetical protein